MSKFIEQRQVIFQKMAQIDQMEYGSLKAEFREGADPSHPLGPYYKHQVWRDGKNHSKRVAGPRAVQLGKAVEGRQQFEQLAQQCIDLTVQHTRASRPATDAKKNSKRRSARKPPPRSRPLSP
jgi:hypothetical protein